MKYMIIIVILSNDLNHQIVKREDTNKKFWNMFYSTTLSDRITSCTITRTTGNQFEKPNYRHHDWLVIGGE